MLKGVLKDREFNSTDETEEATMMAWDERNFDGMQNLFYN
jgi:hypothetical protein